MVDPNSDALQSTNIVPTKYLNTGTFFKKWWYCSTQCKTTMTMIKISIVHKLNLKTKMKKANVNLDFSIPGKKVIHYEKLLRPHGQLTQSPFRLKE